MKRGPVFVCVCVCVCGVCVCVCACVCVCVCVHMFVYESQTNAQSKCTNMFVYTSGKQNGTDAVKTTWKLNLHHNHIMYYAIQSLCFSGNVSLDMPFWELCVYVCACTSVNVWENFHVHGCACMYVCVYVFVCMHACMRVVHVCVHA